MLNNIKLKTSIAIFLLLFLIFSLIAVGLSLMGQSTIISDLSATADQNAALRAALVAAEKSYSTTLWLVGLFILAMVVVAAAIYRFVNRRLLMPLNDLSRNFNAIANGDLSQRVSQNNCYEIAQVFDGLRRMQDSLTHMVSSVRQGVVTISADSEEISAGNTSLSARIEQQVAALQQTASSMEQLAGTVRQNADNAHQANQLAATASTVAQRGGEAVGEVVHTMQGISASSSKIADIVGVIDSIAFQTNILALNAAVEAARAGEQGRGFAVVASEVRALAQRSAQAAREITTLIDDSVSKVSEGSNQVERAGATMQEIVDSVKRVTDIMGEISAATIEQSGGIDQVNLAISQMDTTTLQNAQMVEQSVQLATSMNNEVHKLNSMLARYQTADGQVIDLTAKKRNTPLQRASKSITAATQAPRIATTKKPNAANLAQDRTTVVPDAATLRKKAADIPGMNARPATGKDARLLRPDLSNTKSTSAEDDWVEF